MNRSAKWLALLLAMTVCLACLWGCGKKEDEALPDTPDDTTVQLNKDELPPEASDGMEFCNGSVTLRLIRDENDCWIWKDEPAFPLDETYALELLATAQEILQLQPIEGAGELSEYGLDSTEKYIKLTGKQGQLAVYYLGDLTDNGQYYICRAGDETNKVYLAPAALTAQISRSIYDMATLPQLSAIYANNIKSITVATHAEPQLSVELLPDGKGNWRDGSTDVTEKIQPLLSALENLQLTACVDYKPTEGAAAICGLDPALMCLVVEYTNTVGADATFKIHIGTSRASGYHAMIVGDASIYAVGGDIALGVSRMLH